MNNIKETLLEQQEKLQFDEKSHTYKVGDKKFTSVTTYISTLKSEFPTYQASKAKERKTGISANYYRQLWKLKGTEAVSLGSRVHLFAQYAVGVEAASDGFEVAVEEFFKNEVGDKERISEVKCFRGNIAGTIDLVVINDDNTVTLYDFKTNRKTEEELRETYGKKFKGDKVKDLGASKLNEYFLQLKLYEWIVSENVTVRDTYVVHIQDGKYEIYANELNK